jgi:hypothetical protein
VNTPAYVKETPVLEVCDSSYGKYMLLNSLMMNLVAGFIAVWSGRCMLAQQGSCINNQV